MSKRRSDNKKKGKIRENIEIVITAIIIALIIRIFILEGYKIPTQSLYPNLLENDHILVNKFLYGVRLPIIGIKLPNFTTPERGTIFVFQNPNYKSPGFHLELLDLITFGIFGLDQHPQKNPKNFIKRCLGTPGDRIEWVDRDIKINDKLLNEKSDGIFDYGSVDWGKSSYFKKVDMYYETNGNKTYKIQYKHNYPSYTPRNFYYIPKKDDTLTIKRKFESSDKLLYMIGDLDITDLWESKKVGATNVRGYKDIIEEESSLSFDKYELLSKTVNNQEFRYTIKHDYYFMIGDNRDNSEDSRYFGPVKDTLVIGPPMVKYFPLHRIGLVE